MPRKKLQEVAPEPEQVEAATETQEVAPEPEVSQETTPEIVDNSAGVTEVNETTHATAPVVCWYVWNEKGEFMKSFHEDDHHGEAQKQAEAFASGHEGWTVTA